MSQHQYQMSTVPAPDELAAMHHLGERIDSYPFQKVQGIIVIIVFLFIIIGEIIIGLPFGFFFILVPFLLHPTSARDSFSPGEQLGMTVFGILLVAVFLGIIWLCVKRLITSCRGFGTTIYLYKGGLIHTKGSKAEVLRWDQVRDVRESVSGGTRFRATHTYTIQLVDGRKFIFNDLFKNVQLLGYYLMQENSTLKSRRVRD